MRAPKVPKNSKSNLNFYSFRTVCALFRACPLRLSGLEVEIPRGPYQQGLVTSKCR